MTTSVENSFVNAIPMTLAEPAPESAANGPETRPAQLDLLKKWDNRQADISLAPISCVDVYSELVINKKSLRLTASESDELPIAMQLRSAPAGELLTLHRAGNLAPRLARLTRQSGDKSQPDGVTLHLVAGFAMTAVGHQMHRIPLLLIPVSVVTHPVPGQGCAVRYDGAPLRLNPYIVDACKGDIDEQFEPFARAIDLRDYLRSLNHKLHASLNCRVSANTGLLSLQNDVLQEISEDEQFEIELARTKPGTSFRPLPPAPAHFDAPFAARLLRYIDSDELPEALYDFTSRARPAAPSNGLNAAKFADIPAQRREKLLNCARWTASLGLGNWSIAGLTGLPARVEQMRTAIIELQNSDGFNLFFRPEEHTSQLVTALYRSGAAIDSAPDDLHQHSIGLHADPQTRVLLQTAKVDAATLESEMLALQQTFQISAIPDSQVLSRLIDTIAEREKEPQLTNPLYFKARRRLSEILHTHNGLITDADLIRLRSLAQTLEQIENFTGQLYYKRCFGTLYKGIHTNWQRLDSVVDFARWLARELGSEPIAGRLLESWPSFVREYNGYTEQLHKAALASWQLSILLPGLISPQQPLPAVLRTAQKYHQRIQQWANYLRKHCPDTTLTPNKVMQLCDVSPDPSIADVRLPEQLHHDRILSYIVAHGIDLDTLDSTASWLLNTLERLDIDLPTVRRHLDAESRLDTRSAMPIAL